LQVLLRCRAKFGAVAWKNAERLVTSTTGLPCVPPDLWNRKLSCRRETARHFMSFRNDFLRKRYWWV